jgi:hypothetical protein
MTCALALGEALRQTKGFTAPTGSS